MLRALQVTDYAIIEHVELAFAPGMTVLTGETGAGKSILVDALGLVLGDRADSSAVRDGAERAEITAEFDIDSHTDISAWLDDNDLSGDDACILRRVIGADGRSRGYINGRPATLAMMRELGEQLVDIHGQHEHQSLLRGDEQLLLIDAYGRHEGERAEVESCYRAWQAADERLRALAESGADRAARRELLQFQVNELERFNPVPGEYEELEAEHERLANAGRLAEAAQQALAACDNEDGPHARGLLHTASQSLQDVRDIEPKLADIHEILQQAQIQTGEAADDLRRWLDRFELDPERKAHVEDRIGNAQQLARKHRVQAAELPALLERLQADLAALDDSGANLAKLEQECERLAADYRKTAGALSKLRQQTATELSQRATTVMRELGMPDGTLEVSLETDAERFSPAGLDRIEFRVSANAGQPLRPLAKVASGGELSRISLAIQVTAARAAHIPCMIFDEVDAGIGGGVAEIVGRQLRNVAETRQVLCVTHLAQVASQAHAHLQVAKSSDGKSTHTQVQTLDDAGRVEEVARMLGGVSVTDKTRATAREMLAG